MILIVTNYIYISNMETFFIFLIKRNYETYIHVKYRIKDIFYYSLIDYYYVFLDNIHQFCKIYICYLITKLCSRESGGKLIMKIVAKLLLTCCIVNAKKLSLYALIV